ncbi:MAG: DNA polymerase III subunit delta [Calditrichaeota bacterium]|nr:DNA polymerase III subunit delta [Calditrichota bacterium]
MSPLRGKSVYDAFLKELEAGKLAPIYVFAGSELYLIQQATDEVVSRLLPEEARDLNLDRVSLRDWDVKRIITAVLTYPMMAKRRVVVVEDAEELPPQSVEIWSRYAKRPSPTGCIIFQARGVQLGGRGDRRFKPFVSSPNALCYEFTPFYDNEAVRWVLERVKTKGKAIQPEAAQLLVDEVGTDLSALANEIEKLLLGTSEDGQIDVELVRRIVVGARGYSFYDLQDAIADADLSKSLLIVDRLLELGAKDTAIVFHLANFYRQVAVMWQLMRKATSDAEALETLGLSPNQQFVLRKLRRYVPRVATSEERLERVFDALLKAEIALKSSAGKRDSRRIVELLVYCLVKDVPADVLSTPEPVA